MNKKHITPLIVSFFLSVSVFASCSNGMKNQENTIKAITPNNNSSITLLNSNMVTFLEKENYSDGASNAELYVFNEEQQKFANYLNYPKELVALYDKYDTFKPINNTLKWSKVEDALSYNVKIALDKDLKTIVVDEVVEKNNFTFENPFTNIDYYWQITATTQTKTVKSSVFKFHVNDYLRTINIHGVSNTRDIGGLTTEDGKKTVQGRIYRGARLDDITETGLKQFNSLGIKTDIDLRRLTEGNHTNVTQTNNFVAIDFPYYLEDDFGIHLSSNFDSVGKAIKVFAKEENYPVYMHCTIGRDRTGTLSFLINSLLGVREADIKREYLFSMFATTGAWAKSSTHFYKMIDDLYDYINAFDGATYADKTANYLVNNCGVTMREIESIRKIMLTANNA